jgi:putative transposase
MSPPKKPATTLESPDHLGGNKKFKCPDCGWTADRDPNGARNIMIRALQATAFTITGDDVPSLTLLSYE